MPNPMSGAIETPGAPVRAWSIFRGSDGVPSIAVSARRLPLRNGSPMTHFSDNNRCQLWVFIAPGAGIPGGVFSERALAEEWIAKHSLSGTLFTVVLDSPPYDDAILNGLFTPRKPHESTPEFIASFTPRSMHYHYEHGKKW